MSTELAPKHWVTWGTARGYSHSADEERFLIEEFRRYRGEKPERVHKVLPDRQVASLLLTMLRDGAGPTDLEEIAPNLDPHDLEEVYVAIAERMHSAQTAWYALMQNPAAFDEHADDAARIMPHLVNILRETAPDDRWALAKTLDQKVAETTSKINKLEEKVYATSDPEERCNLHYSLIRAKSCLWDDSLYLPQRVGQLTPTRLSFVLGELA